MGSGERKGLLVVGALVVALFSVPFVMLGGLSNGGSSSERDRATRDADGSRDGAGAGVGQPLSRDSLARRGPTLGAGSERDAAGRKREDGRSGGSGNADLTGAVLEPVVDFSFSNRDPDFAERAGDSLDERDLRCLEQIIADNGLTEASSAFDYDNGDGTLTATELGLQRFCNGRLRELRFGPSSFSTFGYRVARLPKCVGDLDRLIVLEANAVGLQELPREIAQMSDLRRVAASGNELTRVPVELADAPALRELELGENQLATIPAQVAESEGIELLTLTANPLENVPARVARQQQAMVRGQLGIPARELGPFDASCRPPG
jgi:hypothetical protein